MNQAVTLHLGRLPSLGPLFELFNAGKHLNHIAEPVLWAELEKEQEQYQELFGRLGFPLRQCEQQRQPHHTPAGAVVYAAVRVEGR